MATYTVVHLATLEIADETGPALAPPVTDPPVIETVVVRSLARLAPGVRNPAWEHDNDAWIRPPWTDAQRRDPGALVDGCPPYLVGMAILRDVDVSPVLTAAQEYGPLDAGVPDLVAGTMTWTKTVVAKPVTARKAEMIAAVKLDAAARIAAGFAYRVPPSAALHTYQIDDTSQGHMVATEADFLRGASNAHGGYWRSAANINVTLADTEVRALFYACKAHKMGIIRHAQTLIDSVLAGADHPALDAINPAAGWPVNGTLGRGNANR